MWIRCVIHNDTMSYNGCLVYIHESVLQHQINVVEAFSVPFFFLSNKTKDKVFLLTVIHCKTKDILIVFKKITDKVFFSQLFTVYADTDKVFFIHCRLPAFYSEFSIICCLAQRCSLWGLKSSCFIYRLEVIYGKESGDEKVINGSLSIFMLLGKKL